MWGFGSARTSSFEYDNSVSSTDKLFFLYLGTTPVNCDDLIVFGISHGINLFRYVVQFTFKSGINKIQIIIATASSLAELGTITSQTNSLRSLEFRVGWTCSSTSQIQINTVNLITNDVLPGSNLYGAVDTKMHFLGGHCKNSNCQLVEVRQREF